MSRADLHHLFQSAFPVVDRQVVTAFRPVIASVVVVVVTAVAVGCVCVVCEWGMAVNGGGQGRVAVRVGCVGREWERASGCVVDGGEFVNRGG